jgi:hypothetical protein
MDAGCKAHESWPLHDLIYGMLCRPLRVCSSVPSPPCPEHLSSRVHSTIMSLTLAKADGYVPVSVVEALHARLHALETWKAKIKLPSTSCARKRRRLSAPEQATSPWSRCSSKSEQRTTAITPATAAAVFFQQQDLLQLALQHLDLPALRLLKATNRCVASAARRVLCSAEWLATNNAKNLHDVRRLFASKRAFQLPLRVVLERFCPRTGTWTRKQGTLLHLKAKPCGGRHERRFYPVEIRLVVDGEGLHEDPVRLHSHGCCLHTRLQAWDLSAGASIVAEENMGLGLLRPALSEMSENCDPTGS